MSKKPSHVGLESNMTELFQKFCDLTKKEMNSCIKGALGAGAIKLKKKTIENLNNSIIKPGRTKDKYNDRLQDGVIMTKVYGSYGEDLETKVHIMGNRKSGSGTYRLRMLEKGTKERWSLKHKVGPQWRNYKKAKYRGILPAKWFFRSANAAVLPELEHIYASAIARRIEKINRAKIA